MIQPTWQTEDGAIRCYLGDCLDIRPTLEPGSVDAVVTDPPYGIDWTAGGPESKARAKGGYEASWLDSQHYVRTVCAAAVGICLALTSRMALTPGRTNVWHYPPATDMGCFYQPAAMGCSFWGRPTWQPILFYGNAPHNGEQLRPLHYVLTEAAEANGHPCPKPIRAWTWLVIKATKESDTVLDPFAGSFTTAVACIRTGRRFIGIEKEPKYFDIGIKRIEAELSRHRLFEPAPKIVQRSIFGE